jgi:preprotein translocase subunit SecG
MSGRGTANLLTRTTAVLATIFMLLSLSLALLNRGTSGISRSILDTAPPAAQTTPAPPPPAPPKDPSAPTN